MIKVLLADDEVRVCRLVESLIDWEELGMELCGVANNGVQALELIVEKRPDLVITDIRMPGCDGLELIRRAKELCPGLLFVIVSGYRHFEYAQSAIKYGVGDYLLKPIKKEELTATLQKIRREYEKKNADARQEERLKNQLAEQAERMRAVFFTDCILGDKPIPSSLDEVNETYAFSFAPGCFQSFIIKMDNRMGSYNQEEYRVLAGRVLDIVERLRSVVVDLAFYPRGSRIYCLCNYASESAETAAKALRGVLDRLMIQKSIFEGMDFTVCVGGAEEEPAGFRRSMEGALDAMGQRLISFGDRVIRADELTPKADCDPALLAALNRDMSAAAEVLDPDRLRQAVARFASALTGGGVSGRSMLEAVLQAADRYSLLLQNMQLYDLPSEARAAFRENADLCPSADRLFALLADFMAGAMEDILEERKQEESRPIRAAKAFIQENYMHPITLEQVAGEVGFNASYFSTFFKKHCGVGFLEYLSELRIGRAKELLRDTGMSVAEICESVGYTDIKHFTHTFKKITGVKPTEFRKLYS